MKRRTGLLLLAAVTVAAALAAGLTLAVNSDSASTTSAPVRGNYSLAAAKSFTKFPLYSAGDSVDGLPLTAVQYDTQPDVVTFIYGDCLPLAATEGGCALPAAVQVWNACDRNPASYFQDMTSPLGDKKTVRGVPAASFEAGHRLEIQTGRSTVVVFGDHPAAIAGALRGVNNSVPSGVDLPAPAKGAMDGTLGC